MANTPSEIKFRTIFQNQISSTSWSHHQEVIKQLCTINVEITFGITQAFVNDIALPESNLIIFMYETEEMIRYDVNVRNGTSVKRRKLESCKKSFKTECIGFALIELTKEYHMHLHLMLCTKHGKGYGKSMMDFVKQEAQRLKISHRMRYITLWTLVQTINFYRKYGFTHFNPPYSVKEDSVFITPFAERARNFKFKSRQEALENKPMKRLIYALFHSNLIVQYEINFDKLECSRNGIYMAWKIVD